MPGIAPRGDDRLFTPRFLVMCGFSFTVFIAVTLHEPAIEQRPASSRTAMLEWRVLALAVTLFLYTFGYGSITTFSAVYAEAIGVVPKSIYLTTIGVVMRLKPDTTYYGHTTMAWTSEISNRKSDQT